MFQLLDKRMLVAELELVAEQACRRISERDKSELKSHTAFTHPRYPSIFALLSNSAHRSKVESLIQAAWYWALYPQSRTVDPQSNRLVYRTVCVCDESVNAESVRPGHDRRIGCSRLVRDRFYRILPMVCESEIGLGKLNIGDLPVGTVVQIAACVGSNRALGRSVLQREERSTTR